ncbi:ABC transporter ATP-binding protein [Natronosalvus rutilus]|uniref:ATP-binding cassette domain-containing protein n=1 Tax=Natronosalvus rutilus TaxID=2953753 RepID=A0A9E7NDW1_9EURY|nr:oligopeptide/dipeptide ABC transporter ATP-binding protein [Natronosalvus rutilus]UTF55696.1 ATP-binding cassette domain-containing protein [Natronosalvus rutilus]
MVTETDMTTYQNSQPDEIAYGEPLMEVANLTKHFTQSDGVLGSFELNTDGYVPPVRRNPRKVEAVDDVSFEILKGETLGLVGESGCGKSTLARTILRLIEPTDGSIRFKGTDLADMSSGTLRKKRQEIQIIFQDPQSSLNPRMKIGRIVEEPMKAHGLYDSEGREERAKELLKKVGLDPQHYNRYPHAFSGGQRQRVNLARALSVNPDLIVCDEPVSALDVSIQAQVLNTLQELQDEFGLTYLFITHDLSVIRHISDRVAVMYLGKLVEIADKAELFENPQHPYTKALLDSIPIPDPRNSGTRGVLPGDVPSPLNPPSGCRFRTRCLRLMKPDRYANGDETIEYGMTKNEWEQIRAFIRSISYRSLEQYDRDFLGDQFFEDGVPDGTAGQFVSEALSLADDERLDEAEALLEERFINQSICAREDPYYEVKTEYGTSTHIAACHLHNKNVAQETD